jgi:methionine aminotransferase
MSFRSKLPDVGTTIFTVMSRRARELGAINIGQGFPDYPIDPRLTELVAQAMAAGHNQYAPMEGVLELREGIARKLAQSYGVAADPLEEITVTVGATEALYSAIQAVIGPGDEAIAFDPAYDSYEPAVRLAGGRCLRVALAAPEFRYDWTRVREAMTPRTRLIIFNNPLNPSCTVARAQDLQALTEITRAPEIYVLADEVYEHVVFDGRRHLSVLSVPELAARSFAVYSFGKTLHATGLRIGYCVAPRELTRELRKVHQFNTFSVTSPLQHAIAQFLEERAGSWSELAGFFQRKRDALLGALAGSGFAARPAEGTYFQLIDFAEFSKETDTAFAERLLNDARVATIPLSPFYRERAPRSLIRVCLAKRDETLGAAVERLLEFARRQRAA